MYMYNIFVWYFDQFNMHIRNRLFYRYWVSMTSCYDTRTEI